MSDWRVAKSLETLREQVNAAYPARAKTDDGTIGDESHQATASDHNPVGGIVHAMDLTHDPKNGFDSYKFADMLLADKDSRIKYVISNSRIGGDEGFTARNKSTYNLPGPWRWGQYHGANPHDRHVHISVNSNNADVTTAWALEPIKADPAAATILPWPILREGGTGEVVRYLQQRLGIKADGMFGPMTKAAVRLFQENRGLVQDGVVGQYTWNELAKGTEVVTEGWLTNITATVFGGDGEVERSAYDGHRVGENEYVVALPYRFPGDRPKVEVRANGKSHTATIEDVGPWNGITAEKSDPYWMTGARPQAESGTDLNGRRTNRAGIDLSPALGRYLGVDGLGKVDWRIVP